MIEFASEVYDDGNRLRRNHNHGESLRRQMTHSLIKRLRPRRGRHPQFTANTHRYRMGTAEVITSQINLISLIFQQISIAKHCATISHSRNEKRKTSFSCSSYNSIKSEVRARLYLARSPPPALLPLLPWTFSNKSAGQRKKLCVAGLQKKCN